MEQLRKTRIDKARIDGDVRPKVRQSLVAQAVLSTMLLLMHMTVLSPSDASEIFFKRVWAGWSEMRSLWAEVPGIELPMFGLLAVSALAAAALARSREELERQPSVAWRFAAWVAGGVSGYSLVAMSDATTAPGVLMSVLSVASLTMSVYLDQRVSATRAHYQDVLRVRRRDMEQLAIQVARIERAAEFREQSFFARVGLVWVVSPREKSARVARACKQRWRAVSSALRKSSGALTAYGVGYVLLLVGFMGISGSDALTAPALGAALGLLCVISARIADPFPGCQPYRNERVVAVLMRGGFIVSSWIFLVVFASRSMTDESAPRDLAILLALLLVPPGVLSWRLNSPALLRESADKAERVRREIAQCVVASEFEER